MTHFQLNGYAEIIENNIEIEQVQDFIRPESKFEIKALYNSFYFVKIFHQKRYN